MTKPLIYRSLSAVFLISSDLFSKAKPVEQTAALTANTDNKPVLFVESFASMQNTRQIVAKLLEGKDVSLELEFNEISLDESEKSAMSIVAKILEKIRGVTIPYNWMPEVETRADCLATRINRGGYEVSVAVAKRVWIAASTYWGTEDGCLARDGTKPLTTTGRASFDGYQRTWSVDPKHVDIGCQSLDRAEVEAIARHYEWAPYTGE